MNEILNSKTIQTNYKDSLTDIALDIYGCRMATCSCDQWVKIFDLDEATQEWNLSASWKAHCGPVWKIDWAHPEFGQIIATCSFDRTAAIWEEILPEPNNVSGFRTLWVRRTNFVDSRTSITDVKFAPKQLGLILATCSHDGVFRIYEAPDVMNLSHWTPQFEINLKMHCSCIAWNYAMPLNTSVEKTKIKISMNSDHTSHNDSNKSKSMLPIDKKDSYIVIPQVPLIALGSEDTQNESNKLILVYHSLKTSKYVKIENSPELTEPVRDLAFAPRIGRSFDLLAVASNDIKVYSILQVADKQGTLRYEIQLTEKFDQQINNPTKVCWNAFGNILSAVGGECLKMWRFTKKISDNKTMKTNFFGSDYQTTSERLSYDYVNFLTSYNCCWVCIQTLDCTSGQNVNIPEVENMFKKGLKINANSLVNFSKDWPARRQHKYK